MTYAGQARDVLRNVLPHVTIPFSRHKVADDTGWRRAYTPDHAGTWYMKPCGVRSDGYPFFLFYSVKFDNFVVVAGCRVFTRQEARCYWTFKRYYSKYVEGGHMFKRRLKYAREVCTILSQAQPHPTTINLFTSSQQTIPTFYFPKEPN